MESIALVFQYYDRSLRATLLEVPDRRTAPRSCQHPFETLNYPLVTAFFANRHLLYFDIYCVHKLQSQINISKGRILQTNIRKKYHVLSKRFRKLFVMSKFTSSHEAAPVDATSSYPRLMSIHSTDMS